jgi:hypothetical protein
MKWIYLKIHPIVETWAKPNYFEVQTEIASNMALLIFHIHQFGRSICNSWDQCCNKKILLWWSPHCRFKVNLKPNPKCIFFSFHFSPFCSSCSDSAFVHERWRGFYFFLNFEYDHEKHKSYWNLVPMLIHGGLTLRGLAWERNQRQEEEWADEIHCQNSQKSNRFTYSLYDLCPFKQYNPSN